MHMLCTGFRLKFLLPEQIILEGLLQKLPKRLLAGTRDDFASSRMLGLSWGVGEVRFELPSGAWSSS